MGPVITCAPELSRERAGHGHRRRGWAAGARAWSRDAV